MANELKYGDRVHLQNGFSGWQGGYLDTNAPSSDSGAVYQVSTTDTPTRGVDGRGMGSGTWEILSATGKNTGDLVLSGDVIYLRNLFGSGTWLDTNGHADATQKTAGGKLNVLTSSAQDRAPGSGRWRVTAKTSSPQDQSVRYNDVVHLWNLWGDNGGFLETNGGTTSIGGKYDVCTNAYWNRSGDVADWRFVQPQA
jgi:hypothetical protein